MTLRDASDASTRARAELFDELVNALAEQAAAIVLERLDDTRETTGPVSPWLTIPEAAELLRCKRQRVDDLLSAGRLSRFKEGGRTLVARAEVEALVTAERVAQVLPIAPRGRMDRPRAA